MTDVSSPARQPGALEERIAVLEKELSRLKTQGRQPDNPFFNHCLGYQSLDANGCICEVNNAWLKLFGCQQEDAIGKSLAEFIPDQYKRHFLECYPGCKVLGEVLGEQFEMRRKGGAPFVASLLGWIEKDPAGNFLKSHCIVQDITRQKELEDKREFERELLAICQLSSDLPSLMQGLTNFFKRLSGCEAIGIRLKRDGDYPYYQTVGFPETFVKLENSLCARDESGSILLDNRGNPILDCMCGNVISGRFDTQFPFFTEFGTFWTNNTTRLLASTSEADRQANTRNRCNGMGYQSVALIPIKDQKNTYGLVQFNDHRPDRFTAERIGQYEQLVSYVSLTLAKHVADLELRISEKKYRIVVENAQEAITIVQRGRVVLANPAAAKMTGYSQKILETGTFTFLRLIHPKDRESVLAEHDSQLRGLPIPSSHVFRIIRHDGEIRWLEIHATLIEWNGKPASLNFFTDITEKRQAEIARQEYEQNLQAILNAAPETIQLLDLEGRTILANEATAKRLHTSLDNLLGKPVYDFFPPAVAALRKERVDRVAATGEPVFAKDTREGVVFDSYLWPVFDQEGKVRRIAVFAIDNTERDLAEKRLSESLELLKNLASQVPGVVYQFRRYPDGRSAFPYSSPGMYTIYEVTPEEVREDATPVFGRIHPEDHDRVAADIDHSASTLATFYCEFRVILPAQGLRWRWSQAQPQRMEDGGTLWHGIISDITDRKLAEEQLRESNEYLENLINYANVPIIVWDMHSRVTRFNHAFEELTGRNFREVIGKSMDILFPPPEVDKSIALIRQTIDGRQWNHIEINIQHFNGEIRNVLWNSAAIMGSDDKSPTAIIAQGYDVTEQKKAEEEKNRLAIQLQQAHKMEAIGTLAGGIAHDFNNILGGIIGYAEMVNEDCPPGSSMSEDIKQILKAGNRAKELVKQILAFSRQMTMDRIPVQPALIIREAVKLLRASLPSTIRIVQDVDPDCGLVLADPTQLHQILINLATNSLHSMELSGGTLTFSLHRKPYPFATVSDWPDKERAGYLQLSVIDTGCGIEPKIMNRIFDPYFTTKEVGKGTGMGLAMVHGIIKSYDGSITCESTVGKGTAFHIVLPATENRCPEKNGPPKQAPKGNEHILLVDDEDILIEMGRSMLIRLGYKVTARNSSLDALVAFQSQPDDFDLVITDQTMPGMTGVDLAKRLLQIRPDLPIILCTGFSTIVSEEKAKSYGIKGFCLKPITKKEISVKIRSLLDARQNGGI